MKISRLILVTVLFAVAFVGPASLFADCGDPQQSRTIRMFGGGYRLQDSGENVVTGSWSRLRFIKETAWFVGMGSAAEVRLDLQPSLVETSVATGRRFSAPGFPVAASLGARVVAVASPYSDSAYAMGGGLSLILEAPAQTPFGIAISIEPSVVTDLSLQPQWSLGLNLVGVIRSRTETRSLRWERSVPGE